MRNSFFIALVVTLCGASTYWYQSTKAICPVPISYRIGTIDQSFALDQTQAIDYAKQAEAVWEKQVDRDLFNYDQNGDLPIEFVYDDRQASADSEAMQRAELDTQQKKSEEIQKVVKEFQTQYDQLLATYNERANSYETRLADYNAEVGTYNDRGGAPPDVYDRLEEERIALSVEVEELNRLSVELKTIVDKINELADQGNALVEEYNRRVTEYNEEFGFTHEFTQGDYQGDAIHVYKFSNEAELVKVLAHEFGHALGIDHVEGSTSLMYYLLENTGEVSTLSSYDLTSYKMVCGDEESFTQKVRRLVRKFSK
jgi:hypothetical protein